MTSYKDSGVDKNAGYELVSRISDKVRDTYSPQVLGDLGGFGGYYEIPLGYTNPVLVSGTDGVGTKLMIARIMGIHDTVGIDLVAMCVNDIICSGAVPLYFLDYIACGKNNPEVLEKVVSGVAAGCKLAGASLIGGETAEMPGMYEPDEYDLAGFASGIVEKDKMITKEKVKAGDLIVGLPSSGVHSNGFSLIRKVLFENDRYQPADYSRELGMSIGEALLTPTRIYVPEFIAVREKIDIHGISHITGGGFVENIPRCLPENLKAVITDVGTPPPIFDLIQRTGGIEHSEMYETFNMGYGMVFVVDPSEKKTLQDLIPESHVLGEVITNTQPKEPKITLCLT
jgi:phosphoribosylformylglycinamidine cyclo-ligase